MPRVPNVPNTKARPTKTSVQPSSPSRPSTSQADILYNTAVQAFVRRDHIKTQATLFRLLDLLKKQTPSGRRAWYDTSSPANSNGQVDGNAIKINDHEEWLIKALKLVISSHASLYSDPPANTSQLNQDLSALLPPSSPSKLLEHVQITCSSYYPNVSQSSLLPPALISTLLLASIKLQPKSNSLGYAHKLAETWLAEVPDSVIEAITRPRRSKNPEESKRIESLKEGYIKIIELFVGEVLPREGEWEMARAFLDAENVMSSKRKESLYRHLRAMQTRKSNPSSPASSGILPSPSSSSANIPSDSDSPSPSPNRQTHRSNTSRSKRSGSTSSSSSERTARPVSQDLTMRSKILNGLDRKGKGKADSEATGSTSTENVPRHIEVNHGNSSQDQSFPSTSVVSERMRRMLGEAMSILPASLRDRLSHLSIVQVLGFSASASILTLVSLIMGWRRRRRQLRDSTQAGVGAVAVGGSAAVAQVQQRLARIRQRGVLQWFYLWLRWWARKFIGVWKLGTTITYF